MGNPGKQGTKREISMLFTSDQREEERGNEVAYCLSFMQISRRRREQVGDWQPVPPYFL